MNNLWVLLPFLQAIVFFWFALEKPLFAPVFKTWVQNKEDSWHVFAEVRWPPRGQIGQCMQNLFPFWRCCYMWDSIRNGEKKWGKKGPEWGLCWPISCNFRPQQGQYWQRCPWEGKLFWPHSQSRLHWPDSKIAHWWLRLPKAHPHRRIKNKPNSQPSARNCLSVSMR